MSCPRASNLQISRIQMQTLLGMDMAVIEDYYHMTIMDENMNWMKLTYLLSNFTLNPTTSFAHLRLFQNLKTSF
jgi:hypothetical protein